MNSLPALSSYNDYNWPLKNPKHFVFDHQKQTVGFLLRNKRAYVLNDLGTGKTLSVLWTMDILFRMDKIKKILVICPLSTTQSVWGREIFTNFPHLTYDVAHGYKKKDIINSDKHIIIINFDGLKSCEQDIQRQKFDVIIIDELTAFKNADSDRSKIVKRITKKAKAVYGMTGLVCPNSPTEAWSQGKVVNPSCPDLPQYYGQFRDMVVMELSQGVFVPRVGAKEKVYKALQPAIRFTRDECMDLPPLFTSETEVPMTPEQKTIYLKMKEDLIVEYQNGEITAANAGVKLMKLLQITAGAVKSDTGEVVYYDATNKIDTILEIFENLGRTKLVVVAAFRAVVERLNDIFLAKKIRSSFIHGGVPIKNRTAIIDNFQNGDGQIIVFQPASSAHGITLTAASTIVWHSLVASGEVHNQFCARITRAGQTQKQYIQYLISSPAERHLMSLLNAKTNLSSGIMKMFADQDI